MNETPDKQPSIDDGELTPKGQKKVSYVMMAGIAVVILGFVIFVVASAVLNGG
ncbi:hypothetical protein [Arthrobacter sp.]|uniref:hypothetical protein n=1 Tax=Arthrobacter sp. TaxID=1667 RepID=UPI0028116383|nr:hypothetical protein [Arthrobacter sp.]